jgi:MFS family permease
LTPTGTADSGRIAFRHINFRYYMTARFLGAVSSEMQSVAVAWQVYALTGRPMDLGLVGLAQFLPGVFLFLAAGHAADRIPRRRILLACNLGFVVCSLTLLVFSLAGLRSVYPVYAALLAYGVVRAFNGPATQAFLPQLVPAEHFPNAVSWASSIFQAALVAGPVAGGAIYALAGSATAVYSCSAVSNFASFLLILAMRVPAVKRIREPASLGVVLDGIRYIWRNKMILGAISLDLFAVLLGGAVALLPVYAGEILKVGASGLGLLRAGPGIGAVLMAVVVAHYPLRRRAGAAMLWCVFGFGACTVVFGLSRNVALSLAALVAMGACDMVSVIVRHTLIQLGTRDEMRGRVSAVNSVFIGASNQVGQFESGVTAQWFGTVPAVIVGGVGAMVVVALWARLFPELRKVDRLTG